MDNRLYPLKFTPILKERPWGGYRLRTVLGKPVPESMEHCGESWELSAVEQDVSVVANGFLAGNTLTELVEIYMGDLVGERIFEKYGEEFPLLIKLIDARETLSVQVHPDDVTAEKRHHAYGKTEMWYVIEADSDSLIYSGFKQGIDRVSLLKAIDTDTVPALLNADKVKPGDVFYIPSGRVHAIGKGVLLAEIQQTSDITYRIYDWGRTDENGNSRELHTDLAMDVLDYQRVGQPKLVVPDQLNRTVELVKSNYFTVNRLNLKSSLQRDYAMLDSFVVYMCISGSASVIYASGRSETLSTGETVLIPADLKDIIIRPASHCTLLEIYIE